MLTGTDKNFIVQSVENGYRVVDLAKMFNVTPRRIQQIIKESSEDDQGKKKSAEITSDVASEIEELWNAYKIGSRTIYYLLKSKGRNISYYQVYNFMKEKKMVKQKQSRANKSMYDAQNRPLSNILMDYHQTRLDYPYAIVCVDQATKKVLSITESRKITKDVMESTINNLSFFHDKTDIKIDKLILRSGILTILYGATDLKFSIRKKGIENVESDKNGGKVHLALSKFWQSYDKFRWTFENSADFVYWYNNRPVMKSDNRVTTPNQIMEQYLVNQQS